MNTPKGSASSHPQKSQKIASSIDQLKQRICSSNQKLNYLKSMQNLELLQRVRNLQKQIQRLSIVNVQEGSVEANKQLLTEFGIDNYGESRLREGNNHSSGVMKLSFVKQAQGFPFVSDSQVPTQQLSNIEQLEVLKNVTTKSYHENLSNSPNNHEKPLTKHKASNELSHFAQKQFAPSELIDQINQKLLPTVMQSQTYPLLNRYLTSKSALISKLIQLNPQKRNNNSLLISHQRVILKEHLDMTRRVVQDLNKKNEQLEDQIDKDFVMVRNKWEESERELKKLANTKEQQVK